MNQYPHCACHLSLSLFLARERASGRANGQATGASERAAFGERRKGFFKLAGMVVRKRKTARHKDGCEEVDFVWRYLHFRFSGSGEVLGYIERVVKLLRLIILKRVRGKNNAIMSHVVLQSNEVPSLSLSLSLSATVYSIVINLFHNCIKSNIRVYPKFEKLMTFFMHAALARGKVCSAIIIIGRVHTCAPPTSTKLDNSRDDIESKLQQNQAPRAPEQQQPI